MSTDEFRERVKDVVVELAGTGQTGLRLPEGVRRRRRHRRLDRGVRDLRLRRPVGAGQARRAVRALRRGDPQLGTERHHKEYLARLVTGELHGLLRDDRDRSRLQRAGDRHHGVLRPGDRGVRPRHPRRRLHARTTSATPRGTPRPRGVRAARRRRRRRRACTRSSSRCGTRRAGRCRASGSRTAAARSASTASTTAGSGSTACGCRATTLLNRYADVTEAGEYVSAIDNPDRRFFTMLGTLVQGRVCVGRRRDQRQQGGADHRDPLRAAPPSVRSARDRQGDAAARLRPAPAPAAAAAGPHLRPALRAGTRRRATCTASSPTPTAPRSGCAGRSSPVPRRPRPSAPGTPAARSRSAARPAAARATSRSTASTRCARTPTCSRPSRATTPC